MQPEESAHLVGGNMGPVVRVGDAVRKPAGTWTPLVHRLMNELRAAGLPFVPRPLGIDGDTELVEFVPGDVGVYPMPEWVWSDDLLTEVGRWLRRLHDTSAGLSLPQQGWRLAPVQPVECICHGDVTPYNTVCRAGRLTGVIDWDYAVPGPRLWDLGYTAYRWVSLTPPGHPDGRAQSADEQWRRLGLLCEAYGSVSPHDVVAAAIRRLDHLVSLSLELAAQGDPAFSATVRAGHVRLYRSDAEWLREQVEHAW